MPLSAGTRLGPYEILKETVMRMPPGNCAALPFGCRDLRINPMYAPLHSDARFEKLSKPYTTQTLK